MIPKRVSVIDLEQKHIKRKNNLLYRRLGGEMESKQQARGRSSALGVRYIEMEII